MNKKCKQRCGSLSFEWIVITTLLVIGLIGGLGALRNSVLTKLVDMTESVELLNTSAETTGAAGT
ncbi:MAG: hypothetical protein Q4D38_00885 [Planctomycetia bacterium]|nr:hypothetical protein [Planctomycetia bacterium]